MWQRDHQIDGQTFLIGLTRVKFYINKVTELSQYDDSYKSWWIKAVKIYAM